MSVNQELADGFTRHQIFVQRYAKSREREAELFIDRLISSVVYELSDEDLTDYTRARYQRLLVDLRLAMDEIQKKFGEDVLAEMRQFAEYEAEFNIDLLGQHVAVDLATPAPSQLYAAMATDIINLEPKKGYTIRDALSEFGARKQEKIIRQVRDGVVLGYTNDQIAANIESLAPTLKRQAGTLTRTIANRVSVKAREITMRENDDILDGYKWLSTLDSHTSLVCQARDGQVYEDNDKNPKPPAHFNCRSTITYIVKPEYDLGAGLSTKRPAIGPNGEVTQVDSKTTYSQWLKRQPEAFQDEILGRSKADLFRRGKVPLDKFVDENGRELTLAELRDLEQLMGGQMIVPRPGRTPTPIPPEPKAPTWRFRPASEIEFKDTATARREVSRRLNAARQDERHPTNFRFRGRRQDYDKLDSAVRNMDPDVIRGFEASLNDLDALADLFNIPKLRGIVKIRANSRAGADMGDGIMGINSKSQATKLARLERSVVPVEARNDWRPDFSDAAWSETRKARSWTADSYFDNRFDEFRSTLFHEFGHHVHQMYGVKKGEFLSTGWNWTPPVEAKMRDAYQAFKRKAPSIYGDTNEREWFAENFALYFMDKKDKTDPLFRELVEELLKNAFN